MLLDEGFRVSVVTFQHSRRFPVDVLQLEGANISEFEMPVLLHIPNECFPNGLAYALDNARCDALAADALGDVVIEACAPALCTRLFRVPFGTIALGRDFNNSHRAAFLLARRGGNYAYLGFKIVPTSAGI